MRERAPAISISSSTLFSLRAGLEPRFSERSMGWSFWRFTPAQGSDGSRIALSDLENLVLAKLAAHSKPFAGGKGGLDAEEIGRAVGPVGSRVLVDVLLSLQRKRTPTSTISIVSSTTWSRLCRTSPRHSRQAAGSIAPCRSNAPRPTARAGPRRGSRSRTRTARR